MLREETMAPNMTDYAATARTFRWQVPETFNFGADVVDHFAHTADGTALIWANAAGEERRFSFSDMARLTARFASALAARGVRKGDRVLVMLPRIPEWQVAMVGCLKLGAVPIPSIEMLTAKDIVYRVRHAGVRAIIARAEHAEKFADVMGEVPVRLALGDAPGFEALAEALAAGDEAFVPVEVAADDPAVLYYTSGSTGQPKGVLHAARGLYAWRGSAIHWLDLRRGDTIWCTADTGWSKAGTSILFGPWSCGAASFFYDGPFDPKERLRLLEKYGVTVYCAPGTELFRVVDAGVAEHDLSRLRHTVSSGETLNPAVAARWQKATGIPILEAYGQTETLMTLLNYPCVPTREGSMGKPLPGLDLAIIDDTGRRLPPGAEGDIAILTPNPQMMLGYLDEPERTASAHVEGPEGRWFVTGDLGTVDADGYFYHRGRNDDVINSAGYRIGPSEVENALLDHPAVQECAAVAAPHDERGEIVKAFVVLRAGFVGDAALVAALQDHVKRVTAPYKYPRAIAFIDELPKTMTGKVQRKVLRDLEKARAAERTVPDVARA
ncbi:acyl-CoA synthetase [Xanthobacter autotrophicus]|uniref:acyl-CoA synthetase n=1 Tax=Xanthobacter autotrophicus TaxID=280 RepID=UPI0024A6381C|nr:AMP-binding protein [Xanthobacter autotrophicus]MDI4657724.1 AMP-binding protein [Xanthobacter autotrophicus]